MRLTNRHRRDFVAAVMADVPSVDYKQQEESLVVAALLEAVISGCTTLKQAQERLPEFVKYLPQPERKATPNLPSTTDVFDSLTKAGWPKGGA